MKNILIPTDFSVRSLDMVKEAINNVQLHEPMNILLVHFFKMSDNMQELMMLSRRMKDYEHISEEYRNIISQLQKNYPARINSIRVECFYGSTVAVFKNFLFANGIAVIAYDEHYRFVKVNKNSIDPLNIIKKSGCALLPLNTGSREESLRIKILRPAATA